MKNIRKGSRRKYSHKKLNDAILGIFMNFPMKSFNYKQIAHVLKQKDATTKIWIKRILENLTSENVIIKTERNKYRLNAKREHFEGTVDMTPNGSAYIICDKLKDDVFIRRENMNRALNGDFVKFYLFPNRAKRKPEGEVIEILKRKKVEFVGSIEINRNFAFLLPRDKKMPYDIFIPLSQINNAENGDLAIAEITDWPKKNKNPIGRILEVLGRSGENDTEMHAILAEFGLPHRFSKEVEQYAQSINSVIAEKEIFRRKDLRNVRTFTIDPEDAKDFDDALSIKQLPNRNWEVGVHIADVSHYVKNGDILDREAYKRGTSIYLVDRTIPMLPERLSNQLCSLRPNEDKLCFSAIFEMNDRAEVIDYWLGRTIINSDKRFTYDEAQQIIETGSGVLQNEVLKLNKLAQYLRKIRFEKGSIDFHRIEIKFKIDEVGKPLGVFFKTSKEANQLIEEFMLLANKTVAHHVAKMGKNIPYTFVYRVHDNPDPKKLNDFNAFIKKFGYKPISESTEKFTKSFNHLLQEIKGRREENLIEELAIRSMAKAIYTTDNIGHYGLGFSHYTHFTSPIRRYSDIMVHRLLHRYLNNSTSADLVTYKKRCKHASDMEQLAANAERASIKYKQVEFLQDKIGTIFNGTISGVTSWGIYVEIDENNCEGMIHINSLEDDYYIFDEKNYCIIGKYHGKKYQLADKVKIRVLSANLSEKQLNFEFA